MNAAIRKFGLHVVLFMSLCVGGQNGAFAAVKQVAEAGMVVNMDGSVVAKGGDGVLRALALGNKVLSGDMLFTGKDSHARIKFLDGGIMVLKPRAQFQIQNFNFDEKQPKEDQAVFTLIKGGMRAVSGLVGKRGDPDSYGIKTRAATIGIRGTDFGLQLCNGDCADIPTPDGIPLEDGLHVDVAHGEVLIKNAAGTMSVRTGEFSFVKDSNVVPAPVPADRATTVDIPPAMTLDRVRGKGDGTGSGGGAAPTPNSCPAS